MAADAAVARRDDVSAARAPSGKHAVDRLGREAGAVGEDDDGSLGVWRQRLEAAAQRRAHAALPLVAVD